MKYNAFISYSHSQDAELAPGIEQALEKFAKPTFKRRALRIFRDSNDLSISPDLWGKIEEGLKESEYVVYCASVASAKSYYCNEEVKYWLANKSIDNFLVVLTDGELVWDFDNNDFDWERTTALPKLLSGAFKNEPLYVDFRDDVPKEGLTLDNPDFKGKLIYIAATLHKKPVGDMVGEGIKQHKRTLRIRNTALTVVFSLMAIAMGLMVSSIKRSIASKLHFQAKAIEAEDPSIALRIEAAALKRYDFSEFKNSALSIIANNNFYQILSKNDSTYIADFALSAVDSTMVVAYNNGQVAVMNFKGELIQEFKAHEDQINSIARSPNGKLVVTSSYDRTSRIWDLDGTMLHEFPDHSERVNTAKFISNEQLLTGSSDGTLRLWDTSGNTLMVYDGHEYGVEEVSVAADGQSFLALTSGANHSSLHLWSLDGIKRTVLKTPWVTAVSLSPDGETILAGYADGVSRILSKQGDTLRTFQGPEATVTSVSYAPDGQTIITASANGDGQQRNLFGELINEFKGHHQPINNIKFTPDGRALITTSFDKTLRLWALDRVEKGAVQEYNGSKNWINSVAFSSTGKLVFAADDKGTGFVWDSDRNLIHTLEDVDFEIGSAIFTNSSKSLLVLADTGASARLYDLKSKEYTAYSNDLQFFSPVAIARDGSTVFLRAIVSGGILWDLETNTTKEIKDISIASAVFAPDGKSILIGGKDGKARHMDLEGNLLKEYDAHGFVFTSWAYYAVTSVAFSPDGKTIAMGSDEDGNIRISDLRGRVLAEFKGHEATVSSLAFAPDGESLLSVSYDKTARLWDLRGTLLSDFSRQTGEVTAMAFSPNGESILAGSTRGKVRVIRFINVDEFLDNYVQPLNKNQRELYEVD